MGPSARFASKSPLVLDVSNANRLTTSGSKVIPVSWRDSEPAPLSYKGKPGSLPGNPGSLETPLRLDGLSLDAR